MRSTNTAWTAGLLAWLAGMLIGSTSAPAQTQLNPQEHRATAEITEYFRRTTERLARDCLADPGAPGLDEWQKLRPVLCEQLLDMLGLWPLPERTELHATVTGTVEHEEFIVEKLHFQSRPGLYVTANFYRPKTVDKPLPTILYLCGHGPVKIDGVSYGNKASYQHHPAWFARQGYCCLILDTLQLGEIEGLHHGTYRERMWWWVSRGYTPAGVEAWNAVRALDYLQSRPEVDMKRIGVTGRSGGGAYTWWIAAIDERPACLVPVAGITDLENHVVDGCIEGHCDCMYMVNTYGWDFPLVAALVAPRPLLLSNTEKDKIFPLDGVVRTHAKAKKIYELYGAADKLGLLITEGPHKDTQELQVPAFRWMNRWLLGKDEPIIRVADPGAAGLDPKQLKVFGELPTDQRNTTAHEWFVPETEPPAPPRSRDEWEPLRRQWLAGLREKSFRGWPNDPPPLEVRYVAEREANGLKLQVIEFTSDENLRLPIYLLKSATGMPTQLRAIVMNESEWADWVSVMKGVPAFGELFPGSPAAATIDGAVIFEKKSWTCAVLAPRGVGTSQWNVEDKKRPHIQRRFALLGKTADDGRVWDVCRAVQALRTQQGHKDVRFSLEGTGAAAGIALYASLFTPSIEEIHLNRLPVTHRDGPYFLNVLRILDMPQALALAFPSQVVLHDTDPGAWGWAQRVAKLYDADRPPLQFRTRPPGQ